MDSMGPSADRTMNLRLTSEGRPHCAAHRGPLRSADIIWFKPTARNLARLTVAIPAGFRQVPLTQPVGPVPKYPGGDAACPGEAC